MLAPILSALVMTAAAGPPAVVNGRPITGPELVKATRERLEKTHFHSQAKPEEVAEARRWALDHLVQAELRAQEARRRGIAIDRAPLEKLEAAEEKAVGGREKFDAVLAANGIDRARYREVIARDALAAALAKQELAKVPPPTRDEARAFYGKNLARYVVPEAIHVRELCVRVEPWQPEPAWQKAQVDAAALREGLLHGGDFAFAATRQKCDAFAAKGGDLGFVHKGSIDETLEKAAWALKDGEVSPPVRTLRGWHLVKREGTQPARQAAFDEVAASVLAELREARRQAALDALDASLRARARVVVGNAR